MENVRAPGPTTIERCIAAHQRVRHALNADNDLASDEATLLGIIEADATALPPDELLRRFIAAIAFAEARAEEAKLFVAGMRERALRYQTRAQTMRGELLEVMQALGRDRVSSPYGSASIRPGPQSVVVTDEGQIPDEYFRVKREVDRIKLGGDLKQGVIVDGATLSNPMPVVSLRFAKASRIAEEQ